MPRPSRTPRRLAAPAPTPASGLPALALWAALALLALLALLTVTAGCRGAARHPVRTVEILGDRMPARIVIPVRGVEPDDIRDSYGDARSGGRRHEGIDIFAPRYTPVLAATRGIIQRRGENGLGGRVLNITGPGGYSHYYAHMEAWGGQQEGDWVEAGQVIGYVGSSGNAAGGPTHLHYSLYAPGGRAINPYPYLTGRPGKR